MTFNDLVAQLAHFAWGALLVDSISRRAGIKMALLLVIAFFVGKEVIESVWGAWEPVQLWSSGFKDMAFWSLGTAAGLLIWRYKL